MNKMTEAMMKAVKSIIPEIEISGFNRPEIYYKEGFINEYKPFLMDWISSSATEEEFIKIVFFYYGVSKRI